mgnify:CR=1 FL=1
MEKPLTSYNLKQITPYVEKFSSAPDATGGSPLLPKASAGEGCCVSYFKNYLMSECTEALTGPGYYYYGSSIQCTNFELTDIDPFPAERNTVAEITPGSVGSSCACLNTNPYSGTLAYTTYSFYCQPEDFYKANFGGQQILVYPGCTVKISAEGKTLPTDYAYYQPFRGYVYITESTSEACCGDLKCISPSEVEVDLPVEWDLSTGLTSGCYESADLRYRFLYAAFFNDDLPSQPTTCCPGHTLLTPSDPDPCVPSAPFGSYYCVASRGTDCTADGKCGIEYPEPGSESYCGYLPLYSCNEVLKSVDGISVTYTNKTNCVATVYMTLFEDYYYWYYRGFAYNACFSDFNLKYKVEVLSGGCNA